MTLPLGLTFIRIAMSPIFLIIYLYGTEIGISTRLVPFILLAIVVLCELSDIFDGFIARFHNKVTEMGKVLDPMADSLFRLSVFLSFTQGVVQVPLFLVLTFFLRDAVVNMLRTVCALKGKTLSARRSGKVKAIVQANAALFILVLMILYSKGMLELLLFRKMSFYSVAVAALYTLFSGIEYIWAYRKLIVTACRDKEFPFYCK